MKLWEFINRKDLIFVLDRSSEKVTLHMKLVPLDHERFIRSLGKVNFDVMQLEAEGWNLISSKYHISPVVFSGIWSEDYALFVNPDCIVITKLPQKFKNLREKIKNRSVEELFLQADIEVAGVLENPVDSYDIKGDLNEEEISIMNRIVHTNDSLSELTAEMLSFLSGMICIPVKGWMIVGEEHSLVSILGKWIIINSQELKKILLEGENPSVY